MSANLASYNHWTDRGTLAYRCVWTSPVAQRWRIRLQCRRCGLDPGVRKIPLEATPSSILAWRIWKIPWTEEPGGLQSIGPQRVRHSWSNWACTHACHTNGPLTQGQSESIGQQLVKWPPMKNPCQSSIVVIGLVNWILTSAFLVWEILREKQSMFNRKRVKGNLRRESEN